MSRESRCGPSASASGIAGDLLALIILMLVGMGFTLMSATAFADIDRPSGCDNDAAFEVAAPLNG